MRSRVIPWSCFVLLAAVLKCECSGAQPKAFEPDQVAREFDQRSWQHEHGLPSSDRVHAILQTRDGYLWIGTQSGLARFDGRSFVVFDHVSTPALADDDCRTLAEDTEGGLWIGTRRNLLRKSGNQFTAFADRLGPTFAAYPFLCASRNGGVWVGSAAGLGLIRNGQVKSFPAEPGAAFEAQAVNALAEDKAGGLWVAADSGFARFDINRGQFEKTNLQSSFLRRPALGIWQAPEGGLWVLSAEYVAVAERPLPRMWLVRLDLARWPKPDAITEYPMGEGWHERFLAGDSDGAIWVPGASGGIHRLRGGRLEFLPVPFHLPNDRCLSVLLDREENLWLGTDNSGLHRWTPRKVSAWTRREGLAHDNVWSIWEARDGSLLVGTDGGVSQFKAGQARTLLRQDGSPHLDVRAVAEDREGTIWVGTMRSLECIREGASTLVELPGEWFEAKVRALYPGSDGAMWVGTVRGLLRLHKDQRTKYTSAHGLGSDEVRAILEDRSGVLWAGTLGGGLSRFEGGHFSTIGVTNGLPSDNIWALHEDSDGVLWVGTDNGLGCVEGGRITAFTLAQGLPATLVNTLISDDFGRLWIGHDQGIYALDKNQLKEVIRKQRASVTPVEYDESDGLPSLETNGQKSHPAACRTRDGRLCFPTTRGIAIIDPSKIPLKQPAPQAAVEEVRANGRLALGGSPYSPVPLQDVESLHRSGSALMLPPGGARVLEFRYTANTFLAPEKTRFRYRLVGLDNHWIDAGTRREAYFTELHPGDYRFEVIACNHHGVWQETPVTVAFQLAPFFYETWWFYGSCGAVLALLLGLAIGWRARESRKVYQLERANALNEQRRRIAQDIHDDLGASLTHIMRLSDRVRAIAGRKGELNQQAERIASIASEAVDNIGEIVWANNPEYDTLEDLTSYLREHAAAFFADSGITVHLDFPETIPSRAVSGLFRRHLVMLLKESLQNVSKHADAHYVEVRLALPDGRLELYVSDDGRGLPAEAALRFGAGLPGMGQRISELKGDLEISARPGGGTVIRAVIPLEEL